MATPATSKMLGSAPESFDGKAERAETFWSNLANYFYLNDILPADESKRVSAALTYFKLGTPAGEWARERQKKALAATPVTFGTWNTFKDAFSNHFVPAQSQLEAANAMHSTPMRNRLFNDWYQEWSMYADRAGVDENTKMYAFRKNLNQATHSKILGVSPQPTTMADLVKHARAFDQVWHVFRSDAFTDGRPRYTKNRGATTEEGDSAQINLFTGKEQYKKISKEEKDRRFREKLCLYCGGKGHMVKECRIKQNAQNAPRTGQNTKRDWKARATTTQETEKSGESSAPTYEEYPPSATISRLYQDSNPFGLLRPRSAPVNEDF